MRHTLKIEDNYLKNLLSGIKKCEIRINDRDYQLGDTLEFYNPDTEKYVIFTITHVHSGLGLKENYVALSIQENL